MSLDASKMAKFAASAIDDITSLEDYEHAELGDIVIIAEIKNIPIDGDISNLGTAVRYSCTDDRWWVARGLLEAALDSNKMK